MSHRLAIMAAAVAEAGQAALQIAEREADNPNCAGVWWSSGRLTDGRWVQTCIYIGRQSLPFVQEVEEKPDGSRAGKLPQHLPYPEPKGSIIYELGL